MAPRRLSARLAFLAALLLALRGLGPADAGAGSGPRPVPAPADNSSHLADDDPALRRAFDAAEEDLRQERWRAAAERLQGVIDERWEVAPRPEDGTAGRPAPHVVAVGGTSVYEGAWIVARHLLLKHGEPLRAAYAGLYGATARTLLERAADSLDETLLAEVARRFLTLPEGRSAALLLADTARERGDTESAFARLEALEDLEEAGDEPEELRSPWRAARLAREARLLARTPELVETVRAHLERAAAGGARAAVLEERVPWSARAPRPAATRWETSGGAPDRAALPPALGGALRPAARVRLAPEEGAEEGLPFEPDATPGPSPWLPPRAVAGRDAVFVSDGETLWVFDRATQRERDHLLLRKPDPDASEGLESGRVRPDDGSPRSVLPLLEGHTLTLDEPARGPARIYVSCCRRIVDEYGYGGMQRLPDACLAAFVWDGTALLRRWQIGGSEAADPLPAGLSVYGAPCLYGGRLWIAGVRSSEATSDRLESWLLALDPVTGAPRLEVRLGSGSPVRGGRLDEAIPSSPAAAHGRVVVSTSLGFVAAVDAEDGRLAWEFRYSRGIETGRARRMGREQEGVTPRLTGFANEPPLIAFGRTLVAPTDANELHGLATRPRGPLRDLRCWDALDRRTAFPQMAVEYVLGAVGGADGLAPQILVVGKGDAGEGEPPAKVIAGLEPGFGRWVWAFPLPTGRGSVAYGRAALTEREAYVPTPQGLYVLDLTGPREVGLFGPGLFPSTEPGPPDLWTGNLIPLPGQGLFAVNLTHVAFWLLR